MNDTLVRLHGLLSQQFINGAPVGAHLDGVGLWLVVTERGRRYELRDGAYSQHVGDAQTMPIDVARRRALEMREERELDGSRLAYGRPLTPHQLSRFVNAWVSASVSAAAA